MYIRRYNYNKRHRCPGWAGAGWRPTYETERPEDWDSDQTWERWRYKHWWQLKNQCEGGYLWTTSLQDPWIMLRVHRCTKCDVRVLPFIFAWLDPTWVWYHFWHIVVTTKFDNIRWHKSRWVDPPGAPWWSLPQTIWHELGWRSIRWWFMDKKFSIKHWWEDFKVWRDPVTRKLDRDRTMAHYKLQ